MEERDGKKAVKLSSYENSGISLTKMNRVREKNDAAGSEDSR